MAQTKTITFPGERFDKAADALGYARGWEDMTAIRLAGGCYALECEVADHLEEQGLSFAYLGRLPDGRICTIPTD